MKSQMVHTESNEHWRGQFSQERQRLLSTLRRLTEGGIIEDVQHIGATSVPGLPAGPCVDLAVLIWPFPLPPGDQARLEALGYQLHSSHEGAHLQRFGHRSGAFQLFLIEAGSDRWAEILLMRDYWRDNQDARRAYSRQKLEWTAGAHAQVQTAKQEYFLQVLEEARQWWIEHHGFASVQAVASELQGYPHAWYISGGWALDLFLGRVTRVHHDVDVVVARTDQRDLRTHLISRGWGLMTPWQGRLEPWPEHMYLDLPRHQVHALRDGGFIDFQLSDLENHIWRYRRAPEVIRTIERIGLRSESGIPYLAPEAVLLFKSKNTSGRERLKDQPDFEKVIPHLEPERRAWLLWALLAADPVHPWIERLRG